ncbi:mammalian cell entry protein [Mycobacterium sp.]|uniref:mammalian cell entry protein n=1 Tax=Mycobacterium sp. TaxID=1785 RepID=UPI0039C926E3
MDDSSPDNESEVAAAETTEAPAARAEEAGAPTPPRPRGKHRLPPRRAMQAAATQASPPATDDAATPDAAAASEPPEESPDEPAETPEAAATEVAPTEPEATDVTTTAPAGRRKWFKRRPPKAPAAAEVTETVAEPVPEETAGEPAAEVSTTETTDAAEEPEPADGADVVDEAAPADDEAAPADDEAAPADDDAAPTDDEAAPADAAGEVPLAERKPATKRLMIAVAAAAAIFVAAAAFAGAMLQPYLADRVLVDTKLDVARTAASAITTLWTYTPDDMDKLPDRSAKYLSGDFEDQYRKYVDGIAAANKQAQVSNSTQVMGAAVETLEGPNATAVVYTNTTYTSPITKNVPSLQYLSYRLTMQRKESRWLITKMTTITSVDLTPKLGG